MINLSVILNWYGHSEILKITPLTLRRNLGPFRNIKEKATKKSSVTLVYVQAASRSGGQLLLSAVLIKTKDADSHFARVASMALLYATGRPLLIYVFFFVFPSKMSHTLQRF